jgi:hypothetical protein
MTQRISADGTFRPIVRRVQLSGDWGRSGHDEIVTTSAFDPKQTFVGTPFAASLYS